MVRVYHIVFTSPGLGSRFGAAGVVGSNLGVMAGNCKHKIMKIINYTIM